jgi:CRP/FNR family transcriptional regulator, cyclic AMP receptor protein
VDLGKFFDYPTSTEEDRSPKLVFLPGRTDEDWAKLLAHTTTQRFEQGQVVRLAGERGDRALCIVTEGHLEVLIPRGRGSSWRRIATIEPGCVFGEVSFLDGDSYSATVRAITDGLLLRFTFGAFEQLSAREPDLGRAILLDLGRILSVRLRQRTELISSFIA